MLRHCIDYSFGTSRKKASAISYGTPKKKTPAVTTTGSSLRSRSTGESALWILKRLCYRKWLMLFSLKFQRDNRKNALAVAPAKGKIGEKGCIFTALWR